MGLLGPADLTADDFIISCAEIGFDGAICDRTRHAELLNNSNGVPERTTCMNHVRAQPANLVVRMRCALQRDGSQGPTILRRKQVYSKVAMGNPLVRQKRMKPDGPSRETSASRSFRHALVTPQVNPGSL